MMMMMFIDPDIMYRSRPGYRHYRRF